MSNTNGFHPPSTSMVCNGQIETSKRLPSTSSTSSTSSNSIVTTNKRSKPVIILSNINETRTVKKYKTKKQKTSNETNRKRHNHNDSNNNSTKKLKQSTHSRHILTHPILHHHKNQSNNNSSTKRETHYHHHVINNNDHCDSCGELYGEMISCDTCPATFHLLCANPPLSREDVPKGSYFCENCRTKAAEDEITTKDKQMQIQIQTHKPFTFDPKSKIIVNGVKKSIPKQSPLEQIKIPTASNGRSLIQPSGEIKFRATNNTSKTKCSSTNLKRKRFDSSTSSPATTTTPVIPTNVNPVRIATNQIEALRRLLLSCRPEEFRGPSLPFDDPSYNRDSFFQKNSLSWQKFCFICRTSTINHIPSIHCDYCPLTYHLDCLTPPMTSLPSTADKWMCPNHIEPILDRYLLKQNKFSTSERVKIYRQYSQIEHNTIIQDFIHMRRTKGYLLSRTSDHNRLERIDISRIPKVIQEFYYKSNKKSKETYESDDMNNELNGNVQQSVQTFISTDISSLNYDPDVWDLLKSIVDHVTDEQMYKFSSVTDCSLSSTNNKTCDLFQNTKQLTTLDKIDILLTTLNEPNYSIEENKINHDGLAALVAAADCCSTDDKTSSISKSIPNSLSLLIDLSQFRLSHAALIHTRSKNVIYIRKQVIWFGLSESNDICLKQFNHHQTCQYVNERHACLYYDRKRNFFELLNYSEYGTIVNGLRYGLGNLSDDESDDDQNDDNENHTNTFENENLQKCFCLTRPLYHSAWDGPAHLDQGTVVQIGCHEFVFYRHVVR